METPTDRILVADASPARRAVLAAQLRGEPFDLLFAGDADDTLNLAAAHHPQLILLDGGVHGAGVELIRLLRGSPATCDIPVILLLDSGDDAQKLRAMELGAVDYVNTPLERAELRIRVRHALHTRRMIETLARRAQIDALTGLWNRAHFASRLAAELSVARRTGRPLSCLMLDLDHFKRLNDAYGHLFGDEVLQAAARTLVATLRAEDVVCRYGGEEFAVVAPGIDAAACVALAERLRGAVAAMTLTCRQRLVPVTCSIGVADLDDAPGGDILAAADRALYAAKRGGRDRVARAADLAAVA